MLLCTAGAVRTGGVLSASAGGATRSLTQAATAELPPKRGRCKGALALMGDALDQVLSIRSVYGHRPRAGIAEAEAEESLHPAHC